MTARYDIRLSSAYINAHNDFEWFASDVQHIEDIIEVPKGSFKENPQLGVAVKNYLNSSNAQNTIAREVIIQLQSDLYQCNNPLVTYDNTGELTIDPNIEI